MPAYALLRATGADTPKLVVKEVAGPTSYETGGFEVTIDELRVVEAALVEVKNNPGNKLVRASIVAPNKVKIQVFTVSADTSTGEITATEDAAGTDESSLTFVILAFGY